MDGKFVPELSENDVDLFTCWPSLRRPNTQTVSSMSPKSNSSHAAKALSNVAETKTVFLIAFKTIGQDAADSHSSVRHFVPPVLLTFLRILRAALVCYKLYVRLRVPLLSAQFSDISHTRKESPGFLKFPLLWTQFLYAEVW